MRTEFKRKLKIIKDRTLMLVEFYNDYKEYKRWNYNNPSVKTQSAQEAKILRQSHVIEKGLSLSQPRKGFGQAKIKELFAMLDEYLLRGYPTDSIPFKNAISVLYQYVALQAKQGYHNDEMEQMLTKYEVYLDREIITGIKHTSYSELEKQITGNFKEFFESRHSMRQFSEEPVEIEEIEKAVGLAMKAPTACNRQASRVYVYTDAEINRRLGELIDGNTGFEQEVNKYLVVTADISAFYDTFERNQLYVEAGIFALSLVQALHYNGIASCILQNGEWYSKNKKFKAICGNIPDNEKIVLFVAIGYYKEEFNYAVSKRKKVADVLITR